MQAFRQGDGWTCNIELPTKLIILFREFQLYTTSTGINHHQEQKLHNVYILYHNFLNFKGLGAVSNYAAIPTETRCLSILVS